MDAPLDWDLLAVVRSCSSTTTTTTTTTTSPSLSSVHPPTPPLPPTPPTCSANSTPFGFSSPLPTTSFSAGGCQGLQDVCTNAFQSTVSSSSIIASGRSFTFTQQQNQQLRPVVKPSQVIFGASNTTPTSQTHRTKKRKSLMKKVCHVPAEGLSSDMWAWRKYGQKPIKGSPHPRGYYRCSSSKGCLARKQVERNRSNPKMFIVTYTSEHNHPVPTHRNSLAGSTRHKPLTSTATPTDQPTCSSPSVASLSPLTEMSESKTTEGETETLIKDEDDNDMGGLSDLMFNDDFYVGFEQIDGGSDDSDCFSEQFSPSSEFPWLVNGTTTSTAASRS